MGFIRRTQARWLLAIGLLAGSLAALPAHAQGTTVAKQPPVLTETWTVVDDQWMVLEIGGSRVGWMNTLVDRSGDQFRTATATEMTIGRGDAPTHIKMKTVFIETADGQPVKVVSLQNMAQQAVETTWEFAGDKIKQVSKQGGRETASELNAPTVEWLTPYKADQFAKAQREAGAKEFTFRTLDPQNGVKPITATSKHAGQTEFEVDGKEVPVEIWKTMTDVMPIEAAEYIDSDGHLVYQEIPTGIGKITMRVASKEVALAQAVAGDGAGGGPNIMLKSFAKPDKPIENSFKASKAKFKLTAREGSLPDMPSAGAQRVEMSEDRKSAILTVDINDSLDASAAEIANEEFSEPSAMVDYRDEVVSKLANRADDETQTLAKAQELRSIVYKHISKKGMSTAFATASETARMRTGDCSEHGVLLAALLRSEDIPSRVAMGLVYAPEFLGEEGIFGWHMWTQALIDGKWIDLDATLPVHYSAGHVLTNTASLADGMGAAEMGSIMQLIGNVDIQVLEVGYAE